MAINRDYNPLFLGARIWMVRTGTTFNDDTVNLEALPEAPTADEAGPWVFMGRARSFQTQSDWQTAEVKGVGRLSGVWETTELKHSPKHKISFATNDITPEAFELAFGLKDPLADGTEQLLYANGKGGVECWLHIELTDTYNGGGMLASFDVPGMLSLANPLQAQGDPAQAEYEFSTIASPYANFNPVALA